MKNTNPVTAYKRKMAWLLVRLVSDLCALASLLYLIYCLLFGTVSCERPKPSADKSIPALTTEEKMLGEMILQRKETVLIRRAVEKLAREEEEKRQAVERLRTMVEGGEWE